MTTIFYLMTVALATTVLMLLLSEFTRRCPGLVEAYDAHARAFPRPSRVPSTPMQSLEPIPEKERASYYFKLVVNEGLLGLLYLSVLPAAFVLNSRMLAESFEVLFNRAAMLVAQFPVPLPLLGPVTLSVTDFQLYGMALALAQILLGASLGKDWESRSGMRWLELSAGLAPFVAFVVWAAAKRGYILAGDGDVHA